MGTKYIDGDLNVSGKIQNTSLLANATPVTSQDVVVSNLALSNYTWLRVGLTNAGTWVWQTIRIDVTNPNEPIQFMFSSTFSIMAIVDTTNNKITFSPDGSGSIGAYYIYGEK